MIDIGSVLEVEILDMSHEGKGIAKVDGLVIFIDGALIEDIVKIEVKEMKKRFMIGKLIEIIKPSKYRTKSECEVSNFCGGCQLRELEYEKQLELKTNIVMNNLKKVGKLNNIRVNKIIGMKEPLRYRNNVQVPVDEKHIGFYEKETHKIVDINECIIQHELIEKVIGTVRRFMQRFNIQGYNKKTKKGTIRHIVSRISFKTQDMMVIIVTNSKELPHSSELIAMLRNELPSIKTIVQNINDRKTNLTFGNKNNILYGDGSIIDYIEDLKFRISPSSFFQVNPVQTEVLYNKVLEYADLKGHETVVDIYCGIGTISLFLARKAKKVYGIEVASDAIKDAKENAKLNNINNAEFYEGTAEKIFPKLYAEGIKADVVVVDPPRKGCEKEVLDTIISMKPEKVVYVSCNASTLARDLSYLNENGFNIKEVQPVDMFASTYHIECVVGIQKIQ